MSILAFSGEKRDLYFPEAYAKAHGAYRFISGGETSEALLELTGAPTEVGVFFVVGFQRLLYIQHCVHRNRICKKA